MLAIIKNNRVELHKDSGAYERVVGKNDAIACAINPAQTLIAIVRKTGTTELYKINGSYVRTVGKNDAINVSWSGSDIFITRKTGRPELYKENGSYIKSIG